MAGDGWACLHTSGTETFNIISSWYFVIFLILGSFLLFTNIAHKQLGHLCWTQEKRTLIHHTHMHTNSMEDICLFTDNFASCRKHMFMSTLPNQCHYTPHPQEVICFVTLQPLICPCMSCFHTTCLTNRHLHKYSHSFSSSSLSANQPRVKAVNVILSLLSKNSCIAFTNQLWQCSMFYPHEMKNG